MKISVLIPTWNSSKTIAATLDSVLSQTLPADDILVLDDGSTDDTVSVLRRYGPRITLFQQSNAGVARARNALAARASGDLLAFLDHDDLWHPEYLATQRKSAQTHPQAVGFFTGHKDFVGYGTYHWAGDVAGGPETQEVIHPLAFLRQCHRTTGKFASMSLCCITRHVMRKLGPEPFCPEVKGVDDFYLLHSLMLLGPVVFSPKRLVAYRITPGAQSVSLLKTVSKAVRVMELLQPRFQNQPDAQLRKAFGAAFSARRRHYGRMLMGVSQRVQARTQFRFSLKHCHSPGSLAKSLAWLALANLPVQFQPKWPSEWRTSHVNQNCPGSSGKILSGE